MICARLFNQKMNLRPVVLCQHSKSSKLSLNTDDFLFLDSSRYHHVSSLKDTAIFRFGSPLYFATLDVFKKQLFACSISLSVLRAREKLTKKLKQNVTVFAEVSVGKAPLETNVQSKSGDVSVMVESAEESKKSNDDSDGTSDAQNNVGSALMSEQDGDEGGSMKHGGVECEIRNIIVECSTVPFIDTAGCGVLAKLHGEYGKHGVRLILAGCCDDVVRTLRRAEECRALCNEGLYPNVHSAVLHLHCDLLE